MERNCSYQRIQKARRRLTGWGICLEVSAHAWTYTSLSLTCCCSSGRKYKGSTFTSAIRPNPHKKYMLSIEAARATGYRDSLYYFRRNPLLVKITLTQSEKEILIAEKILSQNLRSRIVTMVTARTAFMMGGSKLIKGRTLGICLQPWTRSLMPSPKRRQMGHR